MAGFLASLAQPLQEGTEVQNKYEEETLRQLVYQLLQNDPEILKSTIEEYYHNCVDCRSLLWETHTRQHLYYVLRLYQILTHVRPKVIQIVSDINKAVVKLELYVAYRLPPLTFLFRACVPTTVTLDLGKDDKGRVVILEQVNDISLRCLLWPWDSLFSQFFDKAVQPRVGVVLSKMGETVETVRESYEEYVLQGYTIARALVSSLRMGLGLGMRAQSTIAGAVLGSTKGGEANGDIDPDKGEDAPAGE